MSRIFGEDQGSQYSPFDLGGGVFLWGAFLQISILRRFPALFSFQGQSPPIPLFIFNFPSSSTPPTENLRDSNFPCKSPAQFYHPFIQIPAVIFLLIRLFVTVLFSQEIIFDEIKKKKFPWNQTDLIHLYCSCRSL